jgi:hypothetical protein
MLILGVTMVLTLSSGVKSLIELSFEFLLQENKIPNNKQCINKNFMCFMIFFIKNYSDLKLNQFYNLHKKHTQIFIKNYLIFPFGY